MVASVAESRALPPTGDERADALVTFDADRQHSPAAIAALLAGDRAARRRFRARQPLSHRRDRKSAGVAPPSCSAPRSGSRARAPDCRSPARPSRESAAAPTSSSTPGRDHHAQLAYQAAAPARHDHAAGARRGDRSRRRAGARQAPRENVATVMLGRKAEAPPIDLHSKKRCHCQVPPGLGITRRARDDWRRSGRTGGQIA
jgi:hypothetical protein